MCAKAKVIFTDRLHMSGNLRTHKTESPDRVLPEQAGDCPAHMSRVLVKPDTQRLPLSIRPLASFLL